MALVLRIKFVSPSAFSSSVNAVKSGVLPSLDPSIGSLMPIAASWSRRGLWRAVSSFFFFSLSPCPFGGPRSVLVSRPRSRRRIL